MSWPGALNRLWKLQCLGEARRFRRSMRTVEKTQSELLASIIRSTAHTAYGKHHGFNTQMTAERYVGQVPCVEYEQLAPWIERIADGDTNVLTRDAVRHLEPTSGTLTGRRLIPYTPGLRREFQRAIAVWISDLFHHRPAVMSGRAYWSISPAMRRDETTAGGIRIGFADDSEYLSKLQRALANKLMAVPSGRVQQAGEDRFRYVTWLFLLACHDLSLISIWSPTFLLGLIAELDRSADALLEDLRVGTTSPRANQHDRLGYLAAPRISSERMNLVESVLTSRASMEQKLERLWPNLRVISCWADASAASFVPRIRSLFPNVEIQPKGLISTEAFTSIPTSEGDGALLALRSHFFEFQKTDESTDGTTSLAHELIHGCHYRVIVTTSGGLYRYHTHDVVEVVGFEQDCPRIRFVGRDNQSVDLVGEKLAEPFVRRALSDMFEAEQLEGAVGYLSPVRDNPSYYLLAVEPNSVDGNLDDRRSTIESRLHECLCQNPYYRNAIQMGQLGRARVLLTITEDETLWQKYEAYCLASHMRLGDIKPTCLMANDHWLRAVETSNS